MDSNGVHVKFPLVKRKILGTEKGGPDQCKNPCLLGIYHSEKERFFFFKEISYSIFVALNILCPGNFFVWLNLGYAKRKINKKQPHVVKGSKNGSILYFRLINNSENTSRAATNTAMAPRRHHC